MLLGLGAFGAVFILVDQAFVGFVDARFPPVGTSLGLATLWGLVSRAHLVLLSVPLALRYPRQFGFRIGTARDHWRMLGTMVIANCGVIAGYLWLTGSTTPYSGNQWLLTEVITVPVIEETVWRGLVLIVLRRTRGTRYSVSTSAHLAVWCTALLFGALHANNLFGGVPLQFVTLQILNATLWGVMYGYARAKTDSLYPPICLHAAMNLVVVLF
jgi:membrane protease YdiL (CAAX protease family)